MLSGKPHWTYYLRGAAGEEMALYSGMKSLDGSAVAMYLEQYSVGGEFSVAPDGKKWYFISDHQGNVRCKFTKDSTQFFDYTPFGQTLDESYNDANGWISSERDFESKYMNLQARLYDPVIGRFLSVDPLAEIQLGITPYHYCGNDPVNAKDPSGLFQDEVLLKQKSERESSLRNSISASIYKTNSEFGYAFNMNFLNGTLRQRERDEDWIRKNMDKLIKGWGDVAQNWQSYLYTACLSMGKDNMAKLISKGVSIDVEYVPKVEQIQLLKNNPDDPPSFAFIRRQGNSNNYTLFIANDAVTNDNSVNQWQGVLSYVDGSGNKTTTFTNANYCILHEFGHVFEYINENPLNQTTRNRMENSESYKNANADRRSEIFAHTFATYYAYGSDYLFIGFIMKKNW